MKLPDSKRSLREQDEDVLLTACIWGEARGQAAPARMAVGHVVMNRVCLARWGKTVRDVCLRPAAFSCFNRADANFVKLLAPLRFDRPETWNECYQAARQIIVGAHPDNSGGATHYYDDSIPAPRWAAYYPFTTKLGRLNFYRWTRDGDLAAAHDLRTH